MIFGVCYKMPQFTLKETRRKSENFRVSHKDACTIVRHSVEAVHLRNEMRIPNFRCRTPYNACKLIRHLVEAVLSTQQDKFAGIYGVSQRYDSDTSLRLYCQARLGKSRQFSVFQREHDTVNSTYGGLAFSLRFYVALYKRNEFTKIFSVLRNAFIERLSWTA